MTGSPLLALYLEHLHARMRAQSGKPTARDKELGSAHLPESITGHCQEKPGECLALVTAALREVDSANLIQAIGDGLLENLLNESSSDVRTETATLLRENERFRFAFASGKFASVDPLLLDEWLAVFQELGTTKQRERKRLWAAFA